MTLLKQKSWRREAPIIFLSFTGLLCAIGFCPAQETSRAPLDLLEYILAGHLDGESRVTSFEMRGVMRYENPRKRDAKDLEVIEKLFGKSEYIYLKKKGKLRIDQTQWYALKKDKLPEVASTSRRILADGELYFNLIVPKDKSRGSRLDIKTNAKYKPRGRTPDCLESVIEKKGFLSLEQAIHSIREDFRAHPREISKRLTVISQEQDQKEDELFYVKYVFPDDPKFVEPDYFEFWVDPARGFSLVEVHRVKYYADGRLFEAHRKHITCEQIEGGTWFPKSAKLVYESQNSVVSYLYDVSSVQINTVSDNRLTLASLEVPIGTPVYDYTRGAPPIEYRYGAPPFTQKDLDEALRNLEEEKEKTLKEAIAREKALEQSAEKGGNIQH